MGYSCDDDDEGDNDGGLGNMDMGLGGLAIRILNAYRSGAGNPILDTLLAVPVCLPFLVKLAVSLIKQMEFLLEYETWRRWMERRHKLHYRVITHESRRSTATGRVWCDDEDTHNTILLKAIQLYLHSVVRLDLQVADLDLTSTEDKNAKIAACDDDSCGSYDYYDSDCEYDEADDGTDKTVSGVLSNYKIIQKPPNNSIHVIGLYGEPPLPVKLEICFETESTTTGLGQSQSTTSIDTREFIFSSQQGYAIDDFVERAYSWYMQELRDQEDNARHFYELKASRSTTSSSSNKDSCSCNGPIYTRYRLSDEKTFDSLFFREKQSLLKLVRHFRDRTGKYAIKGYPHKLGLLLHGPPGSGKTSLIKSLAQYTGRSIVNVPLARISTNADLMSIFFDPRKHVAGEYAPIKLGFKDVIFVMEDVDAASKIVKRRVPLNAYDSVDNVCQGVSRIITPKSMWRMLLESNNTDCKELVELLMEKSETLKRAALEPDVIESMVRRTTTLAGLGLARENNNGAVQKEITDDALNSTDALMCDTGKVDNFLGLQARCIKKMIAMGSDVSDIMVDDLLGPAKSSFNGLASRSRGTRLSSVDEEAGASDLLSSKQKMISNFAQVLNTPSDQKKKSTSFIGSSISKTRDQLNLTGLLNVLDGVVDSPGRIVIMTTNHVETLDPALVRSGRIDKRLFLGCMEVPDIILMLEHYFQLTLSENQCVRVENAVSGGKFGSSLGLTPARLEQLTAECDDIEDMLSTLETMSRCKYLGTRSHRHHGR